MKRRKVCLRWAARAITTRPRSGDVVDDDPPDAQLAARCPDDETPHLEGHGLGEMLVLGNRIDLVFAEVAKGQAVFESDHGSCLMPAVVRKPDGASSGVMRTARLA